MKKFIIVVMSIALISSAVFAFAKPSNNNENTNSPNEKQVIAIKKIFNISNDFENFEFYSEDINNATKLTYMWSNDSEHITVSTFKNGNIIDYSHYINSENDSVKVKKKSDMEKISNDLLVKIDKDLLKNYKLTDFNTDLKYGSANLTYNRYVDGIKIINDTINIELDLKSASVREYSRTYSSYLFKDSDFPKKDKAISLEKSMELQNQNNPIKKSYMVYDDGEDRKSILVYTMLNDFKPIDAIDGKLINEPIYNTGREYATEDKVKDEVGGAGLSDVEIKEFKKIKGIKDFSEVKSFIDSNFKIDKDAKLNKSIVKINDRYVYNVEFGGENSYVIFKIDAKDLSLLKYSKQKYSEFSKAKLDENTAIKIAKDFALNFYKKEDIDFENPVVINTEYINKVTFFRIVNSIPVMNNGISIEINNSDKSISFYSLDIDEIKFENNDSIIDINNAKDLFFKASKYDLYYSYIGKGPRLIYNFENSMSPILRAKDGEVIGYDAKPISSSNIAYDNIKNSKYKKEIEYLQDIQIGIPNVKDLKKTISVKEFLAGLETLSGGRDNYILFENISWQYEDIKEDMLDNEIENKYAIRWILNSLDYKGLNNMKDVFDKKIFTDSNSIPSEFKAYFYLAKGLSIYDLDKADPNYKLKTEDALHLIYNIIK